MELKAIKTEVPLAEMFGYATQMRSMSQGRATYSMEFAKYAETPRNVAEGIIAKFQAGGKKVTTSNLSITILPNQNLVKNQVLMGDPHEQFKKEDHHG